jgi:hypothetical protein
MVETITPAVHGGRKASYWLSVAAHILGAAIAAAALGLGLGAVGDLLGAPWGEWGLLGIAAIGGAYALGAAGAPMPVLQQRRQVPDWWRTFFSPVTSSFLYGVGLGAGFLTFLSFGTLVVVAVVALATGEPLLGAVVCAPFGAARGSAVLAGMGARDAERGALVVDRIQAVGATLAPRAVNAVALVAVAGGALAAL